jgi:hypothetical protein
MPQHYALALPSTVWPLLGQSHIHPTVSLTVVWLLYVIGMRASAMATSQELERAICLALRAGLNSCGLCDKAAAAIIGMNVLHFQKALRGEGFRKISITNLGLLPWGFWAHFLPALSAIVLRQHVDELVTAVKEVVQLERRA